MNIINTTQAGKIAGVTASTIGRWCQDGLISAKKIGTAWAISEDSSRSYVDSYEHKQPPSPTIKQRKGNMRVIIDRATIHQEQIEANQKKIDELQKQVKAGSVKPLVVAPGVYSLRKLQHGKD